MTIELRYHKGDRVKLSQKAIDKEICKIADPHGTREGTVTSNCRVTSETVQVIWDGNKGSSAYHHSFIMHKGTSR